MSQIKIYLASFCLIVFSRTVILQHVYYPRITDSLEHSITLSIFKLLDTILFVSPTVQCSENNNFHCGQTMKIKPCLPKSITCLFIAQFTQSLSPQSINAKFSETLIQQMTLLGLITMPDFSVVDVEQNYLIFPCLSPDDVCNFFLFSCDSFLIFWNIILFVLIHYL